MNEIYEAAEEIKAAIKELMAYSSTKSEMEPTEWFFRTFADEKSEVQ